LLYKLSMNQVYLGRGFCKLSAKKRGGLAKGFGVPRKMRRLV
jgi:hypothetical protein